MSAGDPQIYGNVMGEDLMGSIIFQMPICLDILDMNSGLKWVFNNTRLLNNQGVESQPAIQNTSHKQAALSQENQEELYQRESQEWGAS